MFAKIRTAITLTTTACGNVIWYKHFWKPLGVIYQSYTYAWDPEKTPWSDENEENVATFKNMDEYQKYIVEAKPNKKENIACLFI